MAEIFEVGGCVRDELLGIKSKDIDFTFVCTNSNSIEEGWGEMVTWMLDKGFEIFLQTPECYTIRAKFPLGHKHERLAADFVMARKEIGYQPGTRKPILELGDLKDDLIRRDFTVNAIAKDIDGNLIDPFNGVEDLRKGILRTPKNNPRDTMMDDPLRILRALRFSITKKLSIDPRIWGAMGQDGILEKLKQTVSQERIREEVSKMMKFDTISSMRLLLNTDQEWIPGLLEVVFKDNMWLKPTTEKR